MRLSTKWLTRAVTLALVCCGTSAIALADDYDKALKKLAEFNAATAVLHVERSGELRYVVIEAQ